MRYERKGRSDKRCPGGGVGVVIHGICFDQDEDQNRYKHHHHHPHNTWFPTASSSSSKIRLAVSSSATVNSPLTSTTFPQIPFSSSQRVDPNVFPTTPTLTIPAMREQIHSSPQSPFENGHLRPYNPPCSAPTHPVPHPRRPSKGRLREIQGLCCFFLYLLIPFCSSIVVFHSLVHDGRSFILFFSTPGT